MFKKILAAAVIGIFASVAASADGFTGFRVEARIGLDEVKADPVMDESGVMFGIGLGYDLALTDNIIWGVQLSADLSSAEYNISDASGSLTLSAERDLEALGRLGYKASDKLLVYGLAGYANGRIKAALTLNGIGSSSASENGDGFRFGGGAEYLISGNTYGKVEYRYTAYDGDLDRSQVVAAVGIRF